MVTLRCRCEHQLETLTQNVPQHHAEQHLRIAPRVPNAVLPPGHQYHGPEWNEGHMRRQTQASPSDIDRLRLHRQQSHDGRGDPR